MIIIVIVVVVAVLIEAIGSGSSGSFIIPSVLAPKVSYFCPFPIDDDDDDDGSDGGDCRRGHAVLALLAIKK